MPSRGSALSERSIHCQSTLSNSENCCNSDSVRTIEIDEEVFGILLKSVADFGDTPNAVLRRLLGINDPGAASETAPRLPIEDFISSTEFRFAKGAVGRFLAILSWLFRQHSDSFSVVERIRGRGRLYFSKSADELERSGRSVQPKQIPGSPYWVITTTPTDLKQEMLSAVMKALGYDARSTQLAVKVIAHNS